jgi:uncharacterized coiled-coil protein SlyX
MSETQHHPTMKERLEHLKTLRDEIRLDIHLAGMEARTRWEDLEPMTHDAELLYEQVGELAREKVDALLQRLRDFRDSLRYGTESERHPPR